MVYFYFIMINQLFYAVNNFKHNVYGFAGDNHY